LGTAKTDWVIRLEKFFRRTATSAPSRGHIPVALAWMHALSNGEVVLRSNAKNVEHVERGALIIEL